MMNVKHILAAVLCLGGMASVASANDGDVDIRSFEYLDVIETSDGSVWKGVIVEQTPNVSYKVVIAGGSVHVIKAEDVLKMSKQRNREFRGGGAAPVGGGAPMGTSAPTGDGVQSTYQPRSSLPPPFVHGGPRFEPEMAIVFPSEIGRA